MIIKYDDSIVEKPLHLDLDFLQNALENALLSENIIIENVFITMGSSIGENYCSNIYRCKINYFLNDNNIDNEFSNCIKETNNNYKTISLIVKCIHNSEGTEFLNELRVFHKEKMFYKFILPRLEMLLIQYKPPIKFGPSIFAAFRKPALSLVFEDLGSQKFQLGSREKGLDLEHAKLVLKRLAQMHAASMLLFQKMPELKACFQFGMLSKGNISMENSSFMRIVRANLEVLLETMESWPGFEKLAIKIRKYANNVVDNLKRSSRLSDTKWKVLNHGDLWVNNILFHYNDNRQAIDLRFLDFQVSYWNSPGIDLNYFFHTSLQFDVLHSKKGYLLEVYHHSLCETLEQFEDFEKPTLREIYSEFSDYLLYGFFATYTILPLISMDKSISDDSSLDSFNDFTFAKNKFRQVYQFKELREKLMYNLKEFDKAGIFD